MNKKKILKALGISTLAFSVCAVMSLSVVLPTLTANPQTQAIETTQSSPLNLDPETDEIVGYTNNGLAIRLHNVVGSVAYSLQYLTLGTYNNIPVNWLIVAISDKGVVENTSPAGNAIYRETDRGVFNGVIDSSLEYGQIRLISESVFVNNSGYYTYSPQPSPKIILKNTCTTCFSWETPYYYQDPVYFVDSWEYQDPVVSFVKSSIKNISTKVEMSIFSPSNTDITTYLPTNNLRIAKQFGTNDVVSYFLGNIERNFVSPVCSASVYSVLTDGTVQNNSIGSITVSTQKVNGSSGYYIDCKLHVTYSGSVSYTVTSLRPMLIIDISTV